MPRLHPLANVYNYSISSAWRKRGMEEARDGGRDGGREGGMEEGYSCYCLYQHSPLPCPPPASCYITPLCQTVCLCKNVTMISLHIKKITSSSPSTEERINGATQFHALGWLRVTESLGKEAMEAFSQFAPQTQDLSAK